MTKKTISYLEHKLLVAMPQIKNELFAQSVLYIYEHREHGTMGFLMNKPLLISLADILKQLNIELPAAPTHELFILQGGPLSKEQLYILQWNGGGERPFDLVQPQDFLQTLAHGGPSESVWGFLGYAGWSSGQLEKEIINNDWLICPATVEALKVPTLYRWEYCLRMIGIDPFHLSSSIGHA